MSTAKFLFMSRGKFHEWVCLSYLNQFYPGSTNELNLWRQIQWIFQLESVCAGFMINCRVGLYCSSAHHLVTIRLWMWISSCGRCVLWLALIGPLVYSAGILRDDTGLTLPKRSSLPAPRSANTMDTALMRECREDSASLWVLVIWGKGLMITTASLWTDQYLRGIAIIYFASSR